MFSMCAEGHILVINNSKVPHGATKGQVMPPRVSILLETMFLGFLGPSTITSALSKFRYKNRNNAIMDSVQYVFLH